MCIGIRPVFLPSAAGTLKVTGTGNSESESNSRGLGKQETETQEGKEEGNMTAMVESSTINNNNCRLFRLTARIDYNHNLNYGNSNDSQRMKNKMSIIVDKNAVDVSSSDENAARASSFSSSSPNNRKRSRPSSSCQSILFVVSAHTNNKNGNNKRLRIHNNTSSTSRPSSVQSSRSVTFNDVRSSRSSLHSLSEDDKKDLWYSLEDCAAMNEKVKREVEAFRSNNIDKVRHMLCVSSQCSYSKPNTAFLDTVRLDLPDECRGLERTLLPPRETRQNKQEHARKVVEAQQMMKDWFKMGQQEQQEQKQKTSVETKNKDEEAEMTKAPKNEEVGSNFCRRKNNRGGKKQRKSSSSSSHRVVMGSCSSSKLDLVIAARARKSSQSSRLFAQLLGKEVATSIHTGGD
mmetsp:Transcript_2828/g.6195  ORF Transcript_2828/g.6195 Transcript_2828/m.6195 type:complete len:404 (+) Transcript_2828:451-1662(+)